MPPSPCPQCGARLAADSCRERFDAGQLLEAAQPAYYAVHHLSVPCYLLQHNAYSRRGWLEVRRLLGQFLHAGWTPAMARVKVQAQAQGSRRGWSYTRGAKLDGVERIAWSVTVADVRLDSPEQYCADVRRWAESILQDSAALAR